MFGRLTIDDFHQDAIEAAAGISMFVVAFLIIGALFYYKRWKWLWREWLTSVDHKKIGVMYLVISFMMLFKGVFDAVMLRAQQVTSIGTMHGYLEPSHFQQVFTAHGTTMIFFVGMGVVFGLVNLILPLQIGARDVAFPFLNSLSFWLFASGAMFIMISLIIGKFSATGWVAYPPLSGIKYNPGVGVDYWLWSVQISGLGTMLSGINFLVTIFKMRCPGMTLMKMPIFTWSILCTMVLVVFAFPILTATLGLLSFDRLLGMHFFTPDFGGNPMMYVNLIWAWGHPEVYILILPFFGIFSEVVSTFSHKRLFGYTSMVWALVAITFLSFIVWLHHFFTMGAGANVNAFFGIMTMLIAIPTGVKIFNWLFTNYQGRIHFSIPMLWFLAFIFIFTTGGMTGVLLSVAPVDFQLHNSLFLIAHFHSMIIGGVLFGFYAGFTYWFPKITGFTLDEKLGKCAFWCWFVGFLAAFMPLYVLGLMGATRRLDHFESSLGWTPLFIVAAVGAFLISCGIGFHFLQIFISIKHRKRNRDITGDPWNGRTLEWSIPSPPPFYNFAIIPEVHERDDFWVKKHTEASDEKPQYQDIHMPQNTPLGLYIGILSFIFGFAMIWYMFWLAAISFLGMVVCVIIRLSDDHTDYYVPAAEVEKIEAKIAKKKEQACQST
jgi:cytochrome o ubiquinol oxidase subunit 1